MTIDKSLKVKLGAIKNRNVLKRGERLVKLAESERWKEGDAVIGIPKVRVYKISMKKKKKVKSAEEAAAAAGDKKGGDKKPAGKK
jgi:small basic protein (TIGR04137 family)